MGELPAKLPSTFERHVGRIPIYIGLCIFLAQAFTQFSMFFQLPEKVRIVMSRLQTIEDIAAKGAVLHADKEARLDELRHLVEQREVAHKLMLDDDRTQWEAIRELDRRIDEITKGTP